MSSMHFSDFLNQISVMQYLEFGVRILVACACGSAIGYERSRRSKSAGLRTHIIVCCAAALMMIVSKYAFVDLAGPNGTALFGTRGADPARIAAQVISGISFLGAGIIVKHGSTVKGLTTAAGIWATAGIGLAIGAGMYIIGLFSVLVVFMIQLMMHKIKFGTEGWVDTSLDFNVERDKEYNSEFMRQISKWNAKLEEIEITEEDSRTYHYRVIVKISSDIPTEEIIHFLSDDERVSRFSVLPDIPY